MRIVNIVAIAEMEKKFDLNEILDKVKGVDLVSHWIKMRLPDSNKYIAFYRNGNILITGAISEKDVYTTANEVMNYLKKYNLVNDIKKISIKNCVLISQLDFDVNLDDLIVKLFQYDASYEPEQFPALKFKDKHGITYLLFGSGKITITGVKSLDNLEDHVNEFKDLIKEKSI